jgi:hypothetical protein
MSPATLTPQDKRCVTAQARMALLGGMLHRTQDDRGREVFVLTRWNLTRELPTIEAVEAWIDRLEGRA